MNLLLEDLPCFRQKNFTLQSFAKLYIRDPAKYGTFIQLGSEAHIINYETKYLFLIPSNDRTMELWRQMYILVKGESFSIDYENYYNSFAENLLYELDLTNSISIKLIDSCHCDLHIMNLVSQSINKFSFLKLISYNKVVYLDLHFDKLGTTDIKSLASLAFIAYLTQKIRIQ